MLGLFLVGGVAGALYRNDRRRKDEVWKWLDPFYKNTLAGMESDNEDRRSLLSLFLAKEALQDKASRQVIKRIIERDPELSKKAEELGVDWELINKKLGPDSRRQLFQYEELSILYFHLEHAKMLQAMYRLVVDKKSDQGRNVRDIYGELEALRNLENAREEVK